MQHHIEPERFNPVLLILGSDFASAIERIPLIDGDAGSQVSACVAFGSGTVSTLRNSSPHFGPVR